MHENIILTTAVAQLAERGRKRPRSLCLQPRVWIIDYQRMYRATLSRLPLALSQLSRLPLTLSQSRVCLAVKSASQCLWHSRLTLELLCVLIQRVNSFLCSHPRCLASFAITMASTSGSGGGGLILVKVPMLQL
ncbi:hypothetical protein E2C01_049714 [Portunus trituberculatus]|uniref:Uncharacterized protein n=1 Tax=Portunus trituberculatus TaxID=210409 RepID=A0A5B7GDU7_PORTR|nr:hypothetical protein [Portunus trituberculatus]